MSLPLTAALRAAELGATAAAFGGLLCIAAVAWPVLPAGTPLRPGLVRALRALLLVQLAAAALCLPVQAARMAGTPGLAETWTVATGTTFGRRLLARSALVALAVLAAGGLDRRGRVALAAALAGAGLALQPWLGHGAAAPGPLLPAAIAVHALAAGAWIGALPVLAWLAAAEPGSARRLARRFSWLGLGAVAALLASAAVLAVELIGSLGGLLGLAYGLTALAKTAGLVLLLGLAAWHRFALTPALDRAPARRRFRFGLAAEIVLGAGVLGAAATLALLPPAAHGQPVWPFAWRPDLSGLGEPHVRREIWRALALAAAAAAGAAALLFRPLRIAGPLAAAGLVLWLPQPNLRLLLQPATPTSYQRSETGFSAASVRAGEDLVRALCTADCFRDRDDPSDLTPYGPWFRPDGDFFWWLGATFDAIGHSPFPHGTIVQLEDRARWRLIDYFRARAAGTAFRQGDGTEWPFATPAPDLALTCGGRPGRLADLRGGLALLALTRDAPPPLRTPAVPVVLVAVTDLRGAGVLGAQADCLATAPDAWRALELMTGAAPGGLDGTAILVDANGWLRGLLPFDATAGPAWTERLRAVAAAPLAPPEAHRH